jgi:hypothetical protein
MEEKLKLNEVLALVDTKSFGAWKEMNETQRKSVNFWTMNRYCSSVDGTFEEQALAVFATNEYYNKNWNDIRKHEGLLWCLLCATGNGDKIKFHKYQGTKKKSESNSKVVKILSELMPNAKQEEIELLAKLNDKKDIKSFLIELGYTDKEIKDIL